MLQESVPITITTGSATRLLIGGRETPISSRKSMAMLVYVSLQPDQVESRERLAARLWSDSGPDQARAALRQSLRRLILDLGPAADLVEADRTAIRLTRPVTLDIVQAKLEADRGIAPRLLADGELDLSRIFGDFEDIDREFNLWIAVQRERLISQLVGRLEAALAAAATETETLGFAEALSRVDPTHEGACRAAMQAHMALGDTAQAMRSYERLWQVLEEELDVEPSEKTQALYVAIKQGHLPPGLPAAPEPAEDLLAPIAIIVEPVQAVELPGSFGLFRHHLPRRDDRRTRPLPRLASDRRRAGRPRPRRPIGPTFCASVCTAATMRSWSTLRLTDQADGRLIWSERQTATLDGMAALHRTALRNLAVALNVHLSAPRLQSAREVASPMGRKYELWMQAQALMGDWRAESDSRAEAILRDLVATTPSFAPAMVALAQILHARPIVFPGQRRAPAHLEESLALTSRAVNLDPLDFAHASLPGLEPRHRRDARRSTQPSRSRARPERERPLDDHLGGARLRLRRRGRAGARPRGAGRGARDALFPRRPGLCRDRLLSDRRLCGGGGGGRGRGRCDHQPAGVAGGEPGAARRPPGRRAGDAALPRAGTAGLDQRAGAYRDRRHRLVHGLLPDPRRGGAPRASHRPDAGTRRDVKGAINPGGRLGQRSLAAEAGIPRRCNG